MGKAFLMSNHNRFSLINKKRVYLIPSLSRHTVYCSLEPYKTPVSAVPDLVNTGCQCIFNGMLGIPYST